MKVKRPSELAAVAVNRVAAGDAALYCNARLAAEIKLGLVPGAMAACEQNGGHASVKTQCAGYFLSLARLQQCAVERDVLRGVTQAGIDYTPRFHDGPSVSSGAPAAKRSTVKKRAYSGGFA